MIEYDLVLMSVLIFLPAIFGLVTLLIPARFQELCRWWALLGSALALTISLCLLVEYYALLDTYSDRGLNSLSHPSTQLDARADEAQRRMNAEVPEPRLSNDWYASVPWISRFNIFYSLGLDGISMSLILLTTVIIFLAMLASWKTTQNLRSYLALLLILETGVLGTFLAMDLFLLYVFYEMMLIPMYFLIGVWGGPRKKYAAMKFVIYTLVGSLFILLAIIGLYFTDMKAFVDRTAVDSQISKQKRENPLEGRQLSGEYHTFHIPTLQRAGQAAMLQINGEIDRVEVKESGKENAIELFGRGNSKAGAVASLDQPFFKKTYQYILFAFLFVGFAVKVPIFPLHSWLPDAHVEAPTPISMVLAGVLLKLGGYGIIRLAYPICPWAAHQLSLVVASIGAFAIVYGALVAMGQTDFKRLLAYSSISHMGYVIFGIAVWSEPSQSNYWSWAMNGAMFQMIAHGITSAGMFFVVGVAYERAHHREISKFGGLYTSMPFFTGFSAMLFFASMALPGLCGFIGEVFVILGSWHYQPILTVIAILATILTAAYLLWTWQRVYLGTSTTTASYADVSTREATILIIFVVLAVALGILPSLLTQWMEPSVTHLVDQLSAITPASK
ncbi:MAG: NADH-quinone oxidoreductase subunit M [Zavarzinella sp.]